MAGADQNLAAQVLSPIDSDLMLVHYSVTRLKKRTVTLSLKQTRHEIKLQVS